MLGSLWAGLGSRLLDRWSARVVSLSFVFWALGAVAWLWSRPNPSQEVARLLQIETTSPALAIGFVVGGLLLIAGSAALVGSVSRPVIRFLEGFWPRWLEPLRRLCVARYRSRYRLLEARWQKLAARGKTLSPQEKRELLTLDWRLRRFDPDPSEMMPTSLGNTMKSAEGWPYRKFGLDAVKCWPRLWLVLPETARSELTGARSRLDEAVVLWTWSMLFFLWSPLAWWTALVGSLGALIAYRWLVAAAEVYGDLVESAYDLYRGSLYDALGRARPDSPREELAAGRALTAFLWRGSAEVRPTPISSPVKGVRK